MNALAELNALARHRLAMWDREFVAWWDARGDASRGHLVVLRYPEGPVLVGFHVADGPWIGARA